MLLKPRYHLVKFLLCGAHWLVLTLQAPRVSKVNFLLYLFNASTREKVMRIIKMITQRKMLYIFYKQILSTNSLTRYVEVSLETLYLYFVVLRVIRIIWDIELVH